MLKQVFHATSITLLLIEILLELLFLHFKVVIIFGDFSFCFNSIVIDDINGGINAHQFVIIFINRSVYDVEEDANDVYDDFLLLMMYW